MNNPWLLLLMTAAGVYCAKLWREDYRRQRAGEQLANPLPGAARASRSSVAIAVAGALILLVLETAGEYALGITDEQSRMTWLFAAYSVIAAPIIEEIIFRGWLVFDRRGRAVLWLGVLAMSAIFALLHPFLWEWTDSGFGIRANAKAWFSTVMVFATSIWFYVARLAPWNPTRSLLPCFAAHAAKNVGVVAVKASTGFMGGIW